VCHTSYQKRKEENQETTRKTRKEKGHSRTRTNDLKIKGSKKEDKRIDEALKEKLEEKDKIIGNLEVEVVTLRKDIQKKNMQNSSNVLDDIINSKKYHLDKSELGYN
jgi:hypothetical protein